MTAIDRAFQPDPERARVYDRAFEAYVGLYPALSFANSSARARTAARVGAGAGAAA